MAVDRGNKRVAYLYSTFNPAVIRSIAQIIANGKKEGIMVGMCGEAAGDPAMIPFLLAAGLDEFSMTASSVLKAKKLISTLSYEGLKAKLPEMLSLATPEEVKAYLELLRTTSG
jgi:phosphotransferase system enzyme I (PtsI)